MTTLPRHEPLLSKSEMCRALRWSSSFFDTVPLPSYPLGKRVYYRMSDVAAAIESVKQEPKQWESAKTKTRRIINTPSKSKVIDLEARRIARKKRMQRNTTSANEERFF